MFCWLGTFLFDISDSASVFHLWKSSVNYSKGFLELHLYVF